MKNLYYKRQSKYVNELKLDYLIGKQSKTYNIENLINWYNTIKDLDIVIVHPSEEDKFGISYEAQVYISGYNSKYMLQKNSAFGQRPCEIDIYISYRLELKYRK